MRSQSSCSGRPRSLQIIHIDRNVNESGDTIHFDSFLYGRFENVYGRELLRQMNAVCVAMPFSLVPNNKCKCESVYIANRSHTQSPWTEWQRFYRIKWKESGCEREKRSEAPAAPFSVICMEKGTAFPTKWNEIDFGTLQHKHSTHSLSIYSCHSRSLHCVACTDTSAPPIYEVLNWLPIFIDNFAFDAAGLFLLPKRIHRYGAERHGYYADVIIKWYTLHVTVPTPGDKVARGKRGKIALEAIVDKLFDPLRLIWY